MIASLSLSVEFNSEEAIAYDSIQSLYFEIDYGLLGTVLIQNSIRYFWHLKKTKNKLFEPNAQFRRTKSTLFSKLKKTIFNFRKMRRKKDEIIQSSLIDDSLGRIDHNITVELERIKEGLNDIDKIKIMLYEYNLKQDIIKEKIQHLFKELNVINNTKDKLVSS